MHSFRIEQRLSTPERPRRTTGRYDALIDHQVESLSDEKHLEATRRFVTYLSRRWSMDQAIVLVNFDRLSTVIHELTLQSFIRERGTFHKFSIEDWFLVLEFYLHMDGSSSYSTQLASLRSRTSF